MKHEDGLIDHSNYNNCNVSSDVCLLEYLEDYLVSSLKIMK
jgi:hypothetical protein